MSNEKDRKTFSAVQKVTFSGSTDNVILDGLLMTQLMPTRKSVTRL